MRSIWVLLCGLCGALIVCGALLVKPLLAETKDVFAFIPAGGRTLLAQVVASHPPADELQAILNYRNSHVELDRLQQTTLQSLNVNLVGLATTSVR